MLIPIYFACQLARRAASSVLTLEDKINCQKQQGGLEQTDNRKRWELVDRQGETQFQRGELIEPL